MVEYKDEDQLSDILKATSDTTRRAILTTLVQEDGRADALDQCVDGTCTADRRLVFATAFNLGNASGSAGRCTD